MTYWRPNSTEQTLTNEGDSIDSSEDDHDNQEKLVQVKNLVKQYANSDRIVLNNLTFDLYENEITALLGHNGAGLSLFFKIRLFHRRRFI